MSEKANPIAVIADDSEYFCLALQLEFENLGFEVITVNSGPALRQAISSLPESSQALIISDIQMPIENGDLVLNDLENHLNSRGFKAFLLSSDLPEKESKHGFLSKKLPPKELAEKAIKDSNFKSD